MIKFLHAADIHLDSPLRGLDRYEGAPVEECRNATRRALENLVALALSEQVAFVLIVGDLYDGDWLDYNTGLFFGRQMARLRDAKIPVVMIRGNHDAASTMTKDLRPPDNVRVLDTSKPQTLTLDDFGVAIHGQSFPTRAVFDNLAAAYPERTGSLFNIGLLHTGVEGREGHDRYAPCSLDDMRSREYAYWALGHIHQRETLREAGPLIAFPGNIQGRSVREQGPKGCLLVTVDEAFNVTAETRWLDVMRWQTCRVDAGGARDVDELLQRFRDRLPHEFEESEGRLLALRVEFLGTCRAHAAASADWTHFSNEVRQVASEDYGGRAWVEKVVAKTPAPAEARNGTSDDARDELTALLDELRGDDARLKDLGDKSLDDLKAKVSGDLREDLDTPERLRELLDQVGEMLLDRLHGQGAS